MKEKSDKSRAISDNSLLLLSGVLFFLLTAALLFSETQPDWKYYQKEFRYIVSERLGGEKAAQVRAGLQQIWIPNLDISDRCITCHMGINWKGLESEQHPYKTHPAEILESHPVQEFGCTSCHGGQGFATDTYDAHGLIKHWEEPMLGQELEEFYLLKRKNALLELNCNTCHRYDESTEGMPYINRAKKLVKEKGCRACHVINGRGGNIGPDLTAVGEKSAEQFEYERILGFKSVFAWHTNHFKDPKQLVEDTIMPNFHFNTEDAQAMTMLMLSWRSEMQPLEYIPGVNLADIPTPEELERERAMQTGEGAFFVEKRCFVCHSVSTLGIESATNIGPDLSIAVIDVQKRFNMPLEMFLDTPAGTMQMVFSRQIILSEFDKSEIIRKLRLAYDIYLQQQESR